MFEVLTAVVLICLFLALWGVYDEVKNVKSDIAHAIYLLEEKETK